MEKNFSLTSVSISPEVAEKLELSEIHESFRGGQKEVFIATRRGQKVAVKILLHGLHEREQREINFYKNHTHLKGIPRITEILEISGQPIIIEEYIDGSSLDKIKASYAGDFPKVSQLISKLCNIMDPIWDAELVHRDLKPENIIIQPDLSPVVIDFGIYKNPAITTITDTGFQPNTCNFASPEQLNPMVGKISYRSDYFSIGIIAFFLIFERLPFGDTRSTIESVFSKGNLWPIDGAVSCFDPFFEGIFHVKPSMRVRDTQELTSRLP